MKDDLITLAHGGGGMRTQALIRDLIVKHLGNPILERLDDGACLEVSEAGLVMTTDSYVVSPPFFPGGDIGKLAICGTINDMVMQGAEPRFLSMALILEEGFAVCDLERIIVSAAEVVRQAGVTVVTGDTKVVERGKGSGVFINTTGLGIRVPGVDAHVENAQIGDHIIVTGTIGDHGMAVMGAREGLDFKSSLQSDVAPLWELMKPVLDGMPAAVRCLRDPTRGGLAAALCDIAESSGKGIRIDEHSIPLKKEVRGACNLLGLDPLNVANEGKAIIVCCSSDVAQIIEILRKHPLGANACKIGSVTAEHSGVVVMNTAIGGERIVERTSGEDLPRIC